MPPREERPRPRVYVTLQMSPEMFAVYSSNSLPGRASRSRGCSTGPLLCTKRHSRPFAEGKHVGVAESPDSLETEFVGLIPSGSR